MESEPDISVRQEIEKLVEMFTPELRKFFLDSSERELFKLHLGYAICLRNQFRQNQYPHLFRYCSAKVKASGGTLSFDAISGVALRLIWHSVRSE
jgi:hypothetical protein